MLKLLVRLLKWGCFSAVVLVLGNLIRWEGKTVSEQIKVQILNAERAPFSKKLEKNLEGHLSKDLAAEIVGEAKDLALGYPRGVKSDESKRQAPTLYGSERGDRRAIKAAAQRTELGSGHVEKIEASERQKLRALIRELNGPESHKVSGGNP